MNKNEELTKSLVSLIDETLEELEELKKSKFSAAEIKIEGPGDKELAGKPANGELNAKKAEDDKEDEDDKKDDVEKGVLDEAEKAECEKGEDAEDKKEDKKIAQKEVDKHNEKKHGEDKDEDSAMKSDEEQDDLQKSEENKEEKEPEVEAEAEDTLAKSLEEQETLIKSYVDSKFESLEKKIASLTDMIDKIADQPVERKGVPANVQALEKSIEGEEKEPLSKSEVATKLFELKKSGTAIDTADIIRVETGSDADVQTIADKYNL